ncbi:PBS lyase HEAT domain protein repeat-containing protein [Oscillatoria nigro-viridis PCC 7112]|uniref:PBS lyase HEAT domain protein repeat-containing protein n=1 Tax=Phormidium nigroviride PCC 7112 TaxID=179408 RepID=K9VFH2_9CYAN|nr:HEAT repeat domain-containing protein [Oscillatoria nigro-viridis]AFZ06853.1 PBS lyase HEAT domain protein repeat-containing protein [Oscillatoria nigro-viridis PCC 7112]
MENFQISGSAGVRQGVLRSLNLRSEEVERTVLMFLVYTLTSVGLIWLELSTVGLFLDEFGADKMPWIYIASAFIGSSLGFVYSWLQKILPLRRTVVVVLGMMSIPLFLFRFGIGYENIKIAGISIAFITIFLMWLWVEACYVLNDLNTSITSNQLFNIREIKRTYPLVSSGYLVAGVVSGFSLPVLLYVVGLKNVTLISGLMVATGSVLLYYLTEKYSQAFPETAHWTDDDEDDDQEEFTARKVTGPLQKYAVPLVSFFILAEVVYVLVDFQFYSQLEYQNPGDGASWIASFLGIYEGIQGLFQVATQWFASSRLVERIGVFVTAMILPAGIAILGVLTVGASLGQLVSVFIGLILLRFLDELLHYTLLETVSPVLFQPIPDNIRSGIQTLVNGVGEPLSCGATGVGILIMLWVTGKILPQQDENVFHDQQSLIFIGAIVILALLWVFVVWLIRSQYVGLLVKSAERGRLGVTDVDLKALKRAVVETLQKPGGEDEKRSCIELLTQIDPKNVGEVLAPLLDSLSPGLQRQSLETMLQHPNPAYLEAVRALSQQSLPPEVLALALRYIWLTEAEPNIESLRPYLQPTVDPVVRGTAAALIMRRGDRQQKAEATNTLRQMLTHKQERERVMGTRALGEADYLQGLRLHIPNLLQDESLRVRCALLDVISSTHSEEYYPSLLRGLGYKSTREAALQAIVKLHNDAIPLLVYLAEDIHKPDLVRLQAWTALGQIGTNEAIDILVSNLMTAWGTTRRNILRILLKMPSEAGIEGVLDRIGRTGLETLIEQELMFIGQIYAGLVDLSGVTSYGNFSDREANSAREPGNDTAQLLQRALAGLEADARERCFLLMKFLYPLDTVQAAAFNIASGQPSLVARGLEILDNTVDIARKRSLINLLDQHSEREKLSNLSELMVYKPLAPSDRLRRLLELRHFLSDWALACCFHLAREARWSLTAQQTLVCLQHPTGFVREAVLAYLKIASPRALVELLPRLQNDPDNLVSAQVEEMMAELGAGGKR